jgi:hypothetical protein
MEKNIFNVSHAIDVFRYRLYELSSFLPQCMAWKSNVDVLFRRHCSSYN